MMAALARHRFPLLLAPVQIGDVMRGMTTGRVLASKSTKAAEGDIFVSFSGWTEVAIVHERMVENPLPANRHPAQPSMAN